MDEEYRSSSSTSSRGDSTLLSVSDFSGSRSEMLKVSSVDSTSITDDLLRIMAHLHYQMETGMENSTIQWGEILIIQDLSEKDALVPFCFCHAHLQEVADNSGEGPKASSLPYWKQKLYQDE